MQGFSKSVEAEFPPPRRPASLLEAHGCRADHGLGVRVPERQGTSHLAWRDLPGGDQKP